MSLEPSAAAPDVPQATGQSTVDRPRTVDYALYAIAARCVLVIAYSLSLYTARSTLIQTIRTSPQAKGWTDAHINSAFDSAVRSNILVAVIGSVLILLVARFIRDGKNWARWMFAVLVVFPLSPLSDVLRIFGVTADAPILVRALSVLTGLAALAAVILLFIRPSAPFFRRRPMPDGGIPIAGAGSGLLAGLMRPRGSSALGNTAATAKPTGSAPAATGPAAPSRRSAPRAKSRKAPGE
ncbi:hypothetical protein BH10ACT8_BH10ACT8_19280 [soil metagenome]